MRYSWNRIFKMGFALLIILALITACGSNGASNQNTGNGTETGSNQSDEASPNNASATTLRIYVPSNVEEFPAGKDLNNNEISDFIEEQTGYDIEWELQPREGVDQKINIMMASGDTPDLIITSSKEIYANLAQQGLLAPLDEVLEEVGTTIMANVPDETWKAVTYEGKKYAIAVPQNQVSRQGMLVRTDWLEQLGLDIPKTVDEYYETLKAIKEQNPGGDGTIPMLGGAAENNGDAFGFIESFAGAFGLGAQYVEKDGAVVHTYTQPEAKDFLTFMNKLYQEGLLDTDYPVNKEANIKEKLVGEKAAMSTIHWATAKGVVESLNEKNPDAKLEYIHPPVGPDGKYGFTKNTPVRVYMLIPRASKNVKETVDFINKYMEPDVLKTVSYGWEGTHYNEENGLIVATEEAEQIRYRIYYQIWDTEENFLNRVSLKGFSPYYDPITEYVTYTNITDYAPPLPVVEENAQTLKDLTNEYFTKIIAGALPMSAFDEYVEKWNSMGGTASLEAINEWYETFK